MAFKDYAKRGVCHLATKTVNECYYKDCVLKYILYQRLFFGICTVIENETR